MTATANSTLPDPTSEKIKLGKYPRRTYKWRCSWLDWPSGQKREKYAGTPATDYKTRVAAAMSQLIFMTRDECIALADRHGRIIDDWIAKQIKDKADPAASAKEYWARAEEDAWIHIPAWLAREIDRVHGERFIKDHIFAAALYFFGSLDNREVRQWCKYVERRTAEAREIDDQAHAALRSIMSGEAVQS